MEDEIPWGLGYKGAAALLPVGCPGEHVVNLHRRVVVAGVKGVGALQDQADTKLIAGGEARGSRDFGVGPIFREFGKKFGNVIAIKPVEIRQECPDGSHETPARTVFHACQEIIQVFADGLIPGREAAGGKRGFFYLMA